MTLVCLISPAMDDEFLGGLMNSFAAGTIDKTIRVALSFATLLMVRSIHGNNTIAK